MKKQKHPIAIIIGIILGGALIQIVINEFKAKPKEIKLSELNSPYEKQKKSINDLVEENQLKEKDCFFNTGLNEKSIGVELIAYFPCQLINNSQAMLNSKTILCQYANKEKDKTFAFTVDLKKLEKDLTPAELLNSTSSEELKENIEKNGEYISSKRVEVAGAKGVQMITKKLIDNWTVYTYETILYQRKNLITISYIIAGSSEKTATTYFNSQKPTIERLLKKIRFSTPIIN